MKPELSEAELDAFLSEFVEAVLDGVRNGIFFGRTLDEIIRMGGYFDDRLLMVLRFHVDPGLKRWTVFSQASGRYYTIEGMLAREQHLREYLNEQVRQRILADLPPDGYYDWQMVDDLDLTTDEERLALHAQTLLTEQRIRQRFDNLFGPIEIESERARLEEAQALAAAASAAVEERKSLLANRPAPAPEPQPYGVSPRGAEMLAAVWMRHMGIVDAEVTPEKADGGVDVVSGTHLAQVKHYTGKVSVVELREIFGVATAQNKAGLFFTSNGYTADAVRFAASVGLPLFVYSAERGTLTGVNSSAQSLL